MKRQRVGDLRLRKQVTREAARLMYEEGVGQYFTAKRMAAKRLLGKAHAKKLRYRPLDLPSNGEIQDEVLALANLTEGEERASRLFQMRKLARDAMRLLSMFEPRLIGSVATGHVHRESDIDLQLFCDDPDGPERFFRVRDWPYEREDLAIRRGRDFQEYQHIHLVADFPIELTIYPRSELRVRSRSSTDGKPIVRLNVRQVEDLLVQQPEPTQPR